LATIHTTYSRIGCTSRCRNGCISSRRVSNKLGRGEEKCEKILKEVGLGERVKSDSKRLKIEKEVVENMKKA
jgi:hypothetical protein